MNRHYIHCPNCRARMVRTGRKVETGKHAMKRYGDIVHLYQREYECPSCGRLYAYREDSNVIIPGGFKD